MTAGDLKSMCSQWDRSSEEFRQIVAAAVATLGVYQRELADEFEVAESTVSRWAHGVARPHPRLQALIVASIRKRAARSARAVQLADGSQPEVRADAARAVARSSTRRP